MIHTDINFPEGLPVALRDGYRLKHVRPYTRTDMQSGRARQRRTFTSVPSMVNVSWLFADNQAAAFEIWFKEVIHDGTDWFNCTLKSPVGLGEYVCRFTDDMYDGPVLVGVSSWRITAVLEIYERPLVPDGWGELPEFLLGANLFDLAMNSRWPKA